MSVNFRMLLFVFVTGVLLLNLASVKGESDPEDEDAVTATPDYSDHTADYDYNVTFEYEYFTERTPDDSEDDDSTVTATPAYTTPDYDYNVTFEYDFPTERTPEEEVQEVSNPTGGSHPQTHSINKTSGIGLLTASVLLGLAVQQIM